MKKQAKKPIFYKRRAFWWPIAVLGTLVITIVAAFKISPVPGALIIRAVFEDNGAQVGKALEKHTPPVPVSTISNQQYKLDDKDALLDVYFPQSTEAKLPVVIWTHGGAWLSGSKNDNAAYFKLLAAEGFTVIAPNYTRAPEKSYPTQIHQLNEAYTYIEANATRFYADTDKIILAGDSAGSQLSSQIAALVTNPAYAKEVGVQPNLTASQLKGVVLNCGIYMMEGLAQPDPNLPKIVGWGDDVSVWSYAGTNDFSSPVIKQMSPYYHVTSDFPATYITGGNNDPLTDAQSKPFASKLQSLGVAVDELFYDKNHQPGLPHEYQFNLDNDDGKKALAATIAFIKEHTR